MGIQKNNLLVTHPDLMKEWDYVKNQGIDPTTLTHGSNVKVWWKCLKCGHVWEAKICERVRGTGCSNRKCRKFKENNITVTHPDIAAEWHPTLNIGLEVETFTFGSAKKVWWKCSKCGHEWQAKICERVRGTGCPAKGCRKYIHRFVEKNITITHPDLMKEWDYTKNQGIDPMTLTCGSNIKVWWKCSKCEHEWQARICDRVRGTGCSNRKCRKFKENNITVTHPDIAAEWHPTLNIGLEVETFTFGSAKKVWWKCSKCGHEWQAPIIERCTRGSGCPKEKAVKQKSSQEYAIHYFLAKYTEVVHSYQIDAMELDCFLPQYNIGIEYDGAFFHDRERDLKKNRYCFDNNIILYRLREMPLTSLNDTSIDIECLPNNKDLSRAISILIKKIFDKEENVDVPKNIIEIENLREHHWKKNSLLEKFPKIAAEWHTTKNGDLKPSAFSYGSNRSVWWKCSKCGHEWQARISHRTRGSGCPAKGCRKYTHRFVEKILQ